MLELANYVFGVQDAYKLDYSRIKFILVKIMLDDYESPNLQYDFNNLHYHTVYQKFYMNNFKKLADINNYLMI